MTLNLRSYPLSVAALILPLAACGVSRSTVLQKQAEVQRDRAELEAARSAAVPLDSFTRGLRQGAFSTPASFVFLTPADVAKAVSEYFPYQVPARDLLGDATGFIFVRSVTPPQLMSRNRMRLRLYFDGQGVNVRNVPSAYAGEVRKAMDGLQSGVTADLEASLVYYPRNSAISVRVTCTDVNMKRNNDASYRSEVQKYINARMLDRPIQVVVPALNGAPAEAVFVTADHVVIQYR